MSEQTDDAELDALMARIRGELAARRVGADLDPAAPPSAASWAHQVAVDTTRRRYSIAELLRWHDAAFLRAAYLALLGREPDAAAWAPTLARLRRREISRTEVLQALAVSPEGRARDVVITGLRLRRLGLRIARLPGLRSLVAAALANRRSRPAEGTGDAPEPGT